MILSWVTKPAGSSSRREKTVQRRYVSAEKILDRAGTPEQFRERIALRKGCCSSYIEIAALQVRRQLRRDQQGRSIWSINSATLWSSIMSSQALKATVQQSVRMASQVGTRKKCKIVCLSVKPSIDYNLELVIHYFCHQVAEQHGGGFVWRAGVSFQLRRSFFPQMSKTACMTIEEKTWKNCKFLTETKWLSGASSTNRRPGLNSMGPPCSWGGFVFFLPSCWPNLCRPSEVVLVLTFHKNRCPRSRCLKIWRDLEKKRNRKMQNMPWSSINDLPKLFSSQWVALINCWIFAN